MGCCVSKLNDAQKLPQHSHSAIQPPAPRSPRDDTDSSKPFETKMESNASKDMNNQPPNKIKHINNQSTNHIKVPKPTRIQSASNEDDSSQSKSWDLDIDPAEQHRREFKERMSVKKMHLEQKRKTLVDIRDKSFEAQVSVQRTSSFQGLYQIFKRYATNADKSKMDINGLTEALKTFGMVIDNDRNFQKLVFSKFDIDNEREIDYNDFMATMSSLIGTKGEDSLMLMFQIFDIDDDGYLNTEDIARILLAQNQIAVVVMGHKDETTVTYTKKQCLKVARKMITKYDNEDFKDEKISFDVFTTMMMNLTHDEMIMENMSYQPSESIDIE